MTIAEEAKQGHSLLPGADRAPWHPSGDGLPTYQEIIARDHVPPAPGSSLYTVAYDPSGPAQLPQSVYYSHEFFERELEKVWPRTWQPACHIAELAQPGGVFVYRSAAFSALITRTSPTQLKAYFNSCPHRGTELRNSSGKANHFRCPFHGFVWDLHGKFQFMPCEWDLPVDRAGFSLRELQVDTWGGYVFINADMNAPSLPEYLGEMVEHFQAWPVENRVPLLHVTQTFKCNWKAATEAFLETFHLVAVHRQILPRTGDTNTQYDIFPPHVTRMLTPGNIASPNLQPALSEQQIVEAVVAMHWAGVHDGQAKHDAAAMLGAEVIAALPVEIRDQPFTVPDGWTARRLFGEISRAQVRRALGGSAGNLHLSDAELMDAVHYTVFPNFSINGGYMFNQVWWFRPMDVTNPEICQMDFYMTRPAAPGELADAPPLKRVRLGPDERWVNGVPELGGLGSLFDQDVHNLARQQRGFRNGGHTDSTLLNYSESRIKAFHNTLQDYLNRCETGKTR